MIRSLPVWLENWLGAMSNPRRDRQSAAEHRAAMLFKLRPIYANLAWPRLTAEIDNLVLLELSAVEESGLARRFELIQIALQEYAAAMGDTWHLNEDEINCESAHQHVKGLLAAVKTHGRAPSPEEFIEALTRLRSPLKAVGMSTAERDNRPA